jgi:hypothetical protein
MQSIEVDRSSLLKQLHTRPRAEDYVSSFFSSLNLTETEAEAGSGPICLGAEIRSAVSARGTGRTTREDILRVTEDGILNALDTDPIWMNHLLLRRRPDIEVMSSVLADAFEWMPEHVIVPFEDIVVVMRLRSKFVHEICAIVTVEPVYADGDVGYWLRVSIYEGSENTSLLVGFLRVMASHFEVLDYPDAELIGRLKFSFVSKQPIKSYATHPERTQTLFLLPKASNDTQSRKLTRLFMLSALIPFGVVAELKSIEIKELTGLDISKEVCAVALPADGQPAQVVLEKLTSKNDEQFSWMGMAAYLKGLAMPNAPWLLADYKKCKIQDAAIKYAQLIAIQKSLTLRSYHPDHKTSQFIKTTIEQPGWDLYSPLPESSGFDADNENTEAHLDAQIQINEDAEFSPEEPQPDLEPEALVVKDAVPASADTALQPPNPSTLRDIPFWVEENLGPSLEISPRAVREIKKFRHPNPIRIAQALELLAGPRLAIFRGDRFSAQAFHKGLCALGLRDGFSGAERLLGRTGSDYLISHRGRTYILDRHLASNASGFNDPKMVRIYYFYDPGLDKIIVGWLPTHLRTSKS